MLYSSELTEAGKRRGRGAYSQAWTFGSASHAGRQARGAAFIAVVETGADAFVELDADSCGHAARIAKDWMRRGVGMSASVWRVDGGRLADQLALISE